MSDLAADPTATGHLTPADRIHQRIIRRAERTLDELRTRRFTGRAPDIRTVDNRLDAAIELLRIVRSQLHELHALANDRPRAAERLNVRQTRTDYSLDTHGDPRARELYRQIALELIALIEVNTVAAHTMTSWLRTGEVDTQSRRGAQAITGEEFIAVLAAQARRLERGEGEAPLVTQPTHRQATDADALRATIRDLEAVLGKTLPRLTSPQRGRLTPAEQIAHRRAIDAYKQRREARKKHTP